MGFEEDLARFLVAAKKATFAGNGIEVVSERAGFKDLKYRDGEWDYRDSFTGHYFFQGQEIVRYYNKPLWAMSYSGGVTEQFRSDADSTKKIEEFLREALKNVPVERPFRGPHSFSMGNFDYLNDYEGDLRFFRGSEAIKYQKKTVFELDYIGGLIIE